MTKTDHPTETGLAFEEAVEKYRTLVWYVNHDRLADIVAAHEREIAELRYELSKCATDCKHAERVTWFQGAYSRGINGIRCAIKKEPCRKCELYEKDSPDEEE